MIGRKQTPPVHDSKGTHQAKRPRLNFLRSEQKLLPIAIGSSVVGILTLGGYMLMTVATGQPAVSVLDNSTIEVDIPADEVVVAVSPTTLPRRLDGMIVAVADANRVPACVMIENAAFGGVRPQAGLSRASVVYEAVVEGGITRFMALFAGESSSQVGPVRSARDTYLEFTSEYNCAYTHAGGSFTALLALRELALRDLDGLREGQYFWRDDSKASPHNLFTSTDQLYQAITDHSWSAEEPPSYDSWNFVDDDQLRDSGEVNQSLQVSYGGSYDISYQYNTAAGAYERSNGNELQTDVVNGETITVRNVILQHVGEGIFIEGKGRINWPVTGEGDVDIFRNGRHSTGTWKKDSRLVRTKFYDASGNEIPLARGNSWVSLVPPGTGFSYQ